MTADKMLLEAAAKAAGYQVRWHTHWQCFVHENAHNTTSPPTMAGQRFVWVPLDDDGDALRLAVKLKIPVCFDFTIPVGDDPMAPTRRAIVSAAARMGENLNG